MKKLIVLLLAMIAMFSFVRADKIVFAFETYPPYEYVEGGVFKGTDVDTIRDVCKKAGHEAVFKEMPWAQAMLQVENGTVDAIFSLFKTSEREKFLVFPTKKLSSETNVIIVKKGSTKKATKIAEMNGWLVGVTKEYSYGDDFDNSKVFKRDESNSNELLLKKLDAGRMDAAIINELGWLALEKQLGLSGKFEKLFVVSSDPLYVGFSKAKGEKAKKWAEDFSKHLK